MDENALKPNPVMPSDDRGEVPPGDPLGEAATHNKTEWQTVSIATPTSRTIFRAKAIFPFDLFPDEVIIDEIKVGIISRRFFGTENVHNILIKDIKNVDINTVPFFAELKIEGPDEVFKVNFLAKDRANMAKRILLGLLIMSERKVDTSKMGIPELVGRAQELGTGRK